MFFKVEINEKRENGLTLWLVHILLHPADNLCSDGDPLDVAASSYTAPLLYRSTQRAAVDLDNS